MINVNFMQKPLYIDVFNNSSFRSIFVHALLAMQKERSILNNSVFKIDLVSETTSKKQA